MPDAWDLITSATFSRRFGYMDAGHDFDGNINMSDQTADYFGSIGQLPCSTTSSRRTPSSASARPTWTT